MFNTNSADYARDLADMEDGVGGSAHAAGILKDHDHYQVVEPSQKGSYGLTVVFLPAVDVENSPPGAPPGNVKLLTGPDGRPYDRFSPAPSTFTRWFWPVPGVKRFGMSGRQKTLLFDDSALAADRKWTHPYFMLREACWEAWRAKRDGKPPIQVANLGNSESDNWANLHMKASQGAAPPSNVPGGSRQDFKALPDMDVLHVAPCLVFARGAGAADGRDLSEIYPTPQGAGPGDKLPILLLGSTAFKELVDQLNAFRDGVPPSATDFGCLKHPRVTATEYVHWYGKKQRNCPAMHRAEQQRLAVFQQGAGPQAGGWMPPTAGGRTGPGAPTQDAGGKTGDGFGYTCFLSKTFEGTDVGTPVPSEAVEAVARQKLRHPADMYRRVTRDEAAAALCGVGLPDSLIHHAFQSNRDWIPQEIKDRAVQRHSYPAYPPAAPAPAAQAQPAYQPPYGQPAPQQAAPQPGWGQPPVQAPQPQPQAGWGQPPVQAPQPQPAAQPTTWPPPHAQPAQAGGWPSQSFTQPPQQAAPQPQPGWGQPPQAGWGQPVPPQPPQQAAPQPGWGQPPVQAPAQAPAADHVPWAQNQPPASGPGADFPPSPVEGGAPGYNPELAAKAASAFQQAGHQPPPGYAAQAARAANTGDIPPSPQ